MVRDGLGFLGCWNDDVFEWRVWKSRMDKCIKERSEDI